MKGVGFRMHAIDRHGARNIFDFAIAKRLIAIKELVLYLLVDSARDANLARPGYSGEAGGSVDAVAINVVWIRDHVAKIDANPIFDRGVRGQRLVALNDALPDDHAASRRFNGIIENRNKSIGRGFDQPSVVLENTGLNELALDLLYWTVRFFPIGWRWEDAA